MITLGDPPHSILVDGMWMDYNEWREKMSKEIIERTGGMIIPGKTNYAGEEEVSNTISALERAAREKRGTVTIDYEVRAIATKYGYDFERMGAQIILTAPDKDDLGQ
jgi:hypothetical protein